MGAFLKGNNVFLHLFYPVWEVPGNSRSGIAKGLP
jgi:hypothetical protein